METTFIYLAIFASFLALRAVAAHGLRWRAIRASAEFDLLIVLTTLGAFFSSSIALLVLNPIWQALTGAPFVDVKVLDTQGLEWAAGPDSLRLWSLLAIFAIAAVIVGLRWGGKRWLKLAGLFLAITVTLFTTFFSNLDGIGTGFIGSLGYWLSQQGIARGSQPWYFYFIVFPLYEYLPLIGGLFAGVFYLVRRKSLSAFSRAFVPFALWWAALIFLALTLAGEKMPWLSTHIAVPFILLTGWWIGQMLESVWRWSHSVRQRLRTIGRGAAIGGVTTLALLTIRTSIAVNYINYDYTTEFIGYAHGAPGVKWALADIAAIANHTGVGRDLKIAYDDDVSWPMSWYLRDYPNAAFFGDQPNREALDAPVVLAGPKNWPKLERLLGDRYHRFEVIRLWWPIEAYKNLTWDRILRVLFEPDMRAAVWDIVWARDYTRYAELTSQNLNPPADWPLAERMRVYVRKDIAAQMLSLSLGSMMLPDLPAQADAYASVRRASAPEQVIAEAGLNAPRGVAVAPDGSVYVADTGNSRIVKFDRAGKVLTTWGGKMPAGQIPPAPGMFNEPWGLAVDTQGNVFVADTWNHRIQKFDASGEFLLEWGREGQASDGPDKFWGPRGIAVSTDGRVYVTDTGNKRVAVFDATGNFLFDFDTSGEGWLDEPVGIALGPDGNAYVADTWNLRVAVFSAEGKLMTSWPVQGWASDSLDNKPYLAVDTQGRVYVTDPDGYRVIVFSPAGQALAAFGQYGAEEDAFGLPTGIGVEPDGRLWVADAGNNRLAGFAAPRP
ncbi:MAG TPA: SMP-30/gluconolactonase/LRE family protein [Anaerolineae bacterium]|nr:SMP-30/gluconolactonase/LRE family protein [Anaerolineae bacterium]